MTAYYLGTSFGGIFYADEFVGAIVYSFPANLRKTTKSKTRLSERREERTVGYSEDKPHLLFWQKYGDREESIREFIGHLEGYLNWIIYQGIYGGTGPKITQEDKDSFYEMAVDYIESGVPEIPENPSLGDLALNIFNLKDLFEVDPGEIVIMRYHVFAEIRRNLREYLEKILDEESEEFSGRVLSGARSEARAEREARTNPEEDANLRETRDFYIQGETPFLGGAEAFLLVGELLDRYH